MAHSPDIRSIWSWAFYDWANSAFAMVVITGFFPLAFKQYWAQEIPATESTYYLGLTNSVASLIVAMLSPLLGAVADQLGKRKGFLMIAACLGIVATSALYGVAQGQWQLAALLYLIAIIGFSGGNLFYDSLLCVVAPKQQVDRISALGFGLGYLGGGLLFAANVWIVLHPTDFGFATSIDAMLCAFVLTAIWWLLFSVPLVLFVREPKSAGKKASAGIQDAVRQLLTTIKQIPKLPHTFIFLLGYWLYIDGVDTIVRMATDYGLAIGLEFSDLISALLVTQFIGFPAAIAFGRIGERLGAKRGILIAIGIYILVTIYSYWMHTAWQFYLLAGVIGLVQGGVQALSRSLYTRLIPADQTAEFFGFYNMVGKFAAVIGPLLVGWTALLTGDHRVAILSVLVLFIAGASLLIRVNVKEGARQARLMEPQY